MPDHWFFDWGWPAFSIPCFLFFSWALDRWLDENAHERDNDVIWGAVAMSVIWPISLIVVGVIWLVRKLKPSTSTP